MTLGIDTLSSNYDNEDYLFWDIENFASQTLIDDKMYYLYARCDKASTAGSLRLIDDHYQMDRGDGYYYFLVGILNSVVNEERSFAEMYGFTEILPGRITVKKIVSADGLTYFDLENGIIGGDIRITGNSVDFGPILSQISVLEDRIDLEVSSLDGVTDRVSQIELNLDGIESFVSRIELE
jgi:hypothetical protein